MDIGGGDGGGVGNLCTPVGRVPIYYVVTSRLIGGPRDGLTLTNVPPTPFDLVFDEAFAAIPLPDPWAEYQIHTYEYSGMLKVSQQAISWARFHFYRRVPKNDLLYAYQGWWSAR
jgi:hypothetical protein